MSAVDQYLQLFTQYKDLLLANSSTSILNQFRERAFKVLTEKGFPTKGKENYEIIDFEKIFSPDYGLNLQRIDIDANPLASFHCGVPSVSHSPFFQVNDIIKGFNNKDHEIPKGVWIGSFKDFEASFPGELAHYYGKIADIENPVVALNSLLVQDGIIIKIESGVEIESPLQLVNILHNGAPLMAVRRLIIIGEKNSYIQIVSCDHSQTPEVDLCNLQVVEIFAEENARIDLYELEESTEATSRCSSVYSKQEKDSEIQIVNLTLFNGITRNEYYGRLEGESSKINLYGMGIADKTRCLDNQTNVVHSNKKGETNELFKYVVDEEATGSFKGLIKVLKGASGTEAFQSNRNIIVTDSARMFSKPQLEIYEDDVKCSHGCATGELDEKQVFYMQTRGVPEKEAKLLLKQAFMNDVIEKIKLSALRDRMRLLVEKRFAGYQLNCNSCDSSCRQI